MKNLFLVAFGVALSICYNDAVTCKRPLCRSVTEINKFPIKDDPTHYYQCVAIFLSVKRRCWLSKYFDYEKQKCVKPKDWEDVCRPDVETTTEGIETTTEGIETTTEGYETTTEIDETTTESYETTTESAETTDTTTTPNPNPSLPWPIVCDDPWCDTEEHVQIMWPAKTPRNYYECVFNGVSYHAVLKRCDDNRISHFSYVNQTCVRANEWNNICGPLTTSSTTEITIPTTEVPETTTTGIITTTDDTTSPETTTEATTTPSPSLPWPIACDDPWCDNDENVRILWPAKTPRNYYECVSDGVLYKPVLRRCDDNRESHFYYFKQKCVRANEWNNICGAPTTTESTTSTTTTEMTTSEVSSTTEFTTTTPEETTTTSEIVTTTSEETTTTTNESTTTASSTTTPESTSTTPSSTMSSTPTSSTTTLSTTTPESTTSSTTTPSTTTPSTTTPSTTTPSTTTSTSTTTSSTTTESPGLPWPITCDAPKCDTESNRKILWPAKQPRNYYECNGNTPVTKRCDNNQVSHFQYLDQKCVRANEWNNICNAKPKRNFI